MFTLPSSRTALAISCQNILTGRYATTPTPRWSQLPCSQSLITVQGPTAEPGPAGGGPIEHRFFVECKSSITYRSVDELEGHINGVSVPLRVPSCTFAGFRLLITLLINTDFEVAEA